MVLWAEEFVAEADRAAPKRKPAAGDALVEQGADRKPVVAVVAAIVQQGSDLVPQRPPWCSREAEPAGEPHRVAERKIETEQHPLMPRRRGFQEVGEQLPGEMAGRWVVDALTVRPPVADPDAVAAGLRPARRAPVDDHVVVEQQGIWTFSSSCPASCRASTPSCRNIKDVDGRDKPGHDETNEGLTMVGIGMVRMSVVVVIGMMMIGAAAHMMVVPLLRCADGVLVADD